MNIQKLHSYEKEVSAISLFKGEIISSTAIQNLENGRLKEHITKTPALLLCISGQLSYQDETGYKLDLEAGDYTPIEPNVTHWLIASEKSQLLLLK